MSSREQGILEEILNRISGAPLGDISKPAGLAVDRCRLLELKPTQLPHISIYPMEGTSDRKGATSESAMLVKVVLWVKGSNASPVDADLDPLWLWVVQQLVTDESLGGKAIRLQPAQKVWGFSINQAPFGDLDLHFLITYRHSTADPSRI